MTQATTAAEAGGIRRGQLLAILIVTTGVGILAMNMVLPSLPTMAREFDATYGAVQYVLTMFLFAQAFGQLVYGSLSDRFGRRPVMIVGLVIFVAGSLINAFAWNLPMLLIGRVIQGAGGCCGLVLGRAILRDLFDRDKSASMLAFVTMSMVVAPMVGPALGGLFQETVGWRAGMLLLVVTGAAVLVLVFLRLPETHLNRGESSGFTHLLRAAGHLLSNPLFLFYCGIMAFTSATFFAFLGGAPYITIELMGRGPGEFGLWAMTMAVGYIAGNYVTGRYATALGTRRMMRLGTVIGVIGGIIVVGFAVYGPAVPLALFAPMMIVTFSNGLVMASAVSSAVSVRPDLAGAAAGLSGTIQIGTGAVTTILVGAMHDGTSLPTTAMVLLAAALALVCFLAASRYPDPTDAPIH